MGVAVACGVIIGAASTVVVTGVAAARCNCGSAEVVVGAGGFGGFGGVVAEPVVPGAVAWVVGAIG